MGGHICMIEPMGYQKGTYNIIIFHLEHIYLGNLLLFLELHIGTGRAPEYLAGVFGTNRTILGEKMLACTLYCTLQYSTVPYCTLQYLVVLTDSSHSTAEQRQPQPKLRTRRSPTVL